MKSHLKTLPPGYFDQVYAANADPWNFAKSEYERAKYADTLAHLPKPHYLQALEVGCSIGVLTAQLAAFCAHLLAIDIAEGALRQARARCGALGNVRVERMQLLDEEPDGDFDLILVSEVAYYWSRPDLDRAMATLAAHHRAGGHLLLVHWTPPVHDYPLTGDAVHDAWLARPEWITLSDEQRPKYRISVLERTS